MTASLPQEEARVGQAALELHIILQANTPAARDGAASREKGLLKVFQLPSRLDSWLYSNYPSW